ncbi:MULTISPECIES: Ger(x)C family spore germination protein [unclassified Paenibacillus]|uniref:Ger(x)C family spore germination protein n=1 Tax=unclassified Paenibacillus TaxID=185978 RepID=UPI00070E75DE|nr:MULTISPECIES: Ger(x)C family spore germination protein [unclassified Paenibacillus]KQX45981.1 spore gernimation protein GerC [Paenibacillus sp. Root444D2]KRE44676.1 spore gernimation protein GerC [Paenibacillus sp. Soil724D2]
MRRCVIPFVVLLLMIVLLTGCWSRSELNDLAISVGMGFDKKDDQVQVTIQIVNPGAVASKRGGTGVTIPVSTFKATSQTIFEALRKIATQSPRKVYSSHLRILVISEELAREGITPILDGISRNHEMRTDFYIVVAKGTTAEHILKTLTPLEKIPSNNLFTTLEVSEKTWAPTVKVRLDNLISDLQTEGKDPVLTGIQIKGDPRKGHTLSHVNRTDPTTYLQYSGVAIFKNDKLVGWLNEQESKGYNYILNNVKSTIGHITCPKGGILAVEAVRTKSKMKGKVENGKPQIDIDISLEENVGEVQCKIDLMDPKIMKELEKIEGKEVEKIVDSAIQKAKKYDVDIFGFGEAMYRADPKYWDKNKGNWKETFLDLPVHVNTKVKIRRVGTVNDSLVQKTKE